MRKMLSAVILTLLAGDAFAEASRCSLRPDANDIPWLVPLCAVEAEIIGMSDRDAAMRLTAIALSRDVHLPETPMLDVLERAARLWLSSGSPSSAEALALQAHAISPEAEVYHLLVGEAMAQGRKWKDLRAFGENLEDPETHFTLMARAETGAGNPAAGLVLARRAMDDDRNFMPARLEEARALAALNQKSEALTMYHAIIASAPGTLDADLALKEVSRLMR